MRINKKSKFFEYMNSEKLTTFSNLKSIEQHSNFSANFNKKETEQC